jgi:hypothetical protein
MGDALSSYVTRIMLSMSYTVTLWCGCRVYVSCNPATGIAHSRIVEARGNVCPVRRHEVGARLWLWELLPDTTGQAEAVIGDTRNQPDR